MNKRERMDWLPFAQRARAGPDRSLALKATFLLKKYAEKRKPMPKRKIEKKAKAALMKGARADVRAEVAGRAKGRCEGCGGLERFTPLGMDHFYGRAFSEAIETCWMLCRECHREKTENYPSREHWDGAFKMHCAIHHLPFRRRLTKNLARRSRLGETSSDMGSVGGAIGGLPLSTESK